MESSRPPDASQVRKSLAWFRDRPLIGLLGSLASLISIPLSIVLYLKSDRSPGIAVAVGESRSIVLDSRASSALKVFYKDAPVTSDLSIAQIAIWNSGTLAVRDEDILEPPEVRLTPPVPILETRVVRISRPIVLFRVEDSHVLEGRLGLRWRILEKSDGALLQVLYAGGPEVKVSVGGVFAGQAEALSGKPFTRRAVRRESLAVRVFGGAILLGFALITVTILSAMTVGTLRVITETIASRRRQEPMLILVLLISWFSVLAMGRSLLRSISEVSPPSWATQFESS